MRLYSDSESIDLGYVWKHVDAMEGGFTIHTNYGEIEIMPGTRECEVIRKAVESAASRYLTIAEDRENDDT